MTIRGAASLHIARSEQAAKEADWDHVREFGYGARRAKDNWCYTMLWRKGLLSPEQHEGVVELARLIEYAESGRKAPSWEPRISGGVTDYNGQAMKRVRARLGANDALIAARESCTDVQARWIANAFAFPHRPIGRIAKDTRAVSRVLMFAAVKLASHFGLDECGQIAASVR